MNPCPICGTDTARHDALVHRTFARLTLGAFLLCVCACIALLVWNPR